METHDFIVTFLADWRQWQAAGVQQAPAQMQKAAQQIERSMTSTGKSVDSAGKSVQTFGTTAASQGKSLREFVAEQSAAAKNIDKSGVSMKQATTEAYRYKSSVEAAARQLGVSEATVVSHDDAMTKSTRNQKLVNRYMKETGQAGKEAKRGFLDAFRGHDTLMSTIGKVALWTIATSAVFGMVRSVGELAKRSIGLEKSLADLKRVMPSEFIPAVTNQITGMAESFGIATDSVIKATFEWGKTTRNLSDIIFGQQASVLAVKVGEMELADATKYLTAMYHSMGLRGQELIDTVDKLNALQNQWGANIEGTMRSMARSGSYISAFGGSINQLMGMTAAAMKMTGEMPEKVSTLWRTMPKFMEKNQSKLQELGVSVRKTKTEYYSAEQQLNSLMKAYAKADDATRRRLVALSAEGRSAMILRTLLENQDVAMAMVETTTHAAGSAVVEYSQIMDTTAEKTARLTAAFDRLSMKSGISRFAGGLIDSFRAVLDSVLGISDALDELGGVVGKGLGKLPGITEAGAEKGFTRVRALPGTIAMAPAVAPGRQAQVGEVGEYYRKKLEDAKDWKAREEIIGKYMGDWVDIMLGIEPSPEAKFGVALDRLVNNREELVAQTKENLQKEISLRVVEIEQSKVLQDEYKKITGKAGTELQSRIALINEMAKYNELINKHKEELIKEEKLRSKSEGDLTEIQQVEQGIIAVNLEEAQSAFNVGLLSYSEYLERLKDSLKDTSEYSIKYTKEWYDRTKTLQKLMEQQESAIADVAKAQVEYAGAGALEIAQLEAKQATKEYLTAKKRYGPESEQSLKARAKSLRAGVKQREAFEATQVAELSLQRELATSEVSAAQKSLDIAKIEYNNAKGKTERLQKELELVNAQKALRTAQKDQALRLLDISDSLSRTELESINLELQRAETMRKYAQSNEDMLSALKVKLDAQKRREEYARSIVEAQSEYESSLARDPIERAQTKIEGLKKVLALTKEYRDRLGILSQLDQERWSEEEAVRELDRAREEARIARILEPLERETELLFMQQQDADWIRRSQGEAAALQAETDVYERAKGLREQRFDYEKRILEMRRDLGEITVQQEIAAIIELAKSVEMTKEQSLQLRLELQRLQEEAEKEKREAFALPSIALPTMYEIRRSMFGGYGAGATMQPYTDQRQYYITVSSNVDLNKLEAVLSKGIDSSIYISGGTRGLGR